MTNTTGGNAPISAHPSVSSTVCDGTDCTVDPPCSPAEVEHVTVETFAITLSGSTGQYFATRRRWWTGDVAAEYGAGVAIAAVDETQVRDLIADNTNLLDVEREALVAELVAAPGTIHLIDPDGGRTAIPAVELAAVMVLAVDQATLVRTMTRMASEMVRGA